MYNIYSVIRASLVTQMVKNLLAMQETWVRPLDLEDPLEQGMVPTPVFLTGEFQGQRSLVGCSPWDHKESDMTERLRHTHIYTYSHSSYIYILLNHFVVHQKLTQHCKLTILQFKKKREHLTASTFCENKTPEFENLKLSSTVQTCNGTLKKTQPAFLEHFSRFSAQAPWGRPGFHSAGWCRKRWRGEKSNDTTHNSKNEIEKVWS